MKRFFIPSLFLGLMVSGLGAQAQTALSPVGLWKTIDDETRTEKSLVRITEAGGAIVGRIEKLLEPGKQEARCEKCTDARKDQPVLGMTIINSVKPNEDRTQWEGGEILDPNNGKTYKVRLKPVESGQRMEVRGYIGAPILGRTQVWVRVE